MTAASVATGWMRAGLRCSAKSCWIASAARAGLQDLPKKAAAGRQRLQTGKRLHPIPRQRNEAQPITATQSSGHLHDEATDDQGVSPIALQLWYWEGILHLRCWWSMLAWPTCLPAPMWVQPILAGKQVPFTGRLSNNYNADARVHSCDHFESHIITVGHILNQTQ